MIEFSGQVAIVTGAGRGRGRLFALDLARRGASVVVSDLGGSMHGQGADASVADQVVEEIRSAREHRSAFRVLAYGHGAERGSNPTADDIAAHTSELSATTPFTIPTSIFDEVMGICERLSNTP